MRNDEVAVRRSRADEAFAAVASKEGEGGEGILESHFSAEEVLRNERTQFKYQLGYLYTLLPAVTLVQFLRHIWSYSTILAAVVRALIQSKHDSRARKWQ